MIWIKDQILPAGHPIEDAFWPESLELNLCNCVGPAPGEKKCKCQIKEEMKWRSQKN